TPTLFRSCRIGAGRPERAATLCGGRAMLSTSGAPAPWHSKPGCLGLVGYSTGYGDRAVAFAGHRVGLETGRPPLSRNGATTWLPWSTVSDGRFPICASP